MGHAPSSLLSLRGQMKACSEHLSNIFSSSMLVLRRLWPGPLPSPSPPAHVSAFRDYLPHNLFVSKPSPPIQAFVRILREACTT